MLQLAATLKCCSLSKTVGKDIGITKSEIPDQLMGLFIISSKNEMILFLVDCGIAVGIGISISRIMEIFTKPPYF